MDKQLLAGITAEGSTDEAFLKIIVERTLKAISVEYGVVFDIYELNWFGSYLKSGPTPKIHQANEAGSQLLFVHHDLDQHSREDIDNWHIEPFRAALEASDDASLKIVPLIIGYEQETWMLSDFEKLNEILGGKLNRQALNLPPDLESRAHTKEIMKQAIQIANEGQTRKRGYTVELISEQLANELDLNKLATLASYQAFKAATVNALREIGYLPPAEAA